MQGVDTTRNRPRRWGTTRALLWERWRTGGWLAVGACAVPWLGGLLLLLHPIREEFLGGSTLLAFVALTIVLLVRRSGKDLMTGVPPHQLRLPVNTRRLALANYGYALFWVGVFVAPLGVGTILADAVFDGKVYTGYLFLHALCVIAFVWAHVISWMPAARQSAFLFVLGLLLVIPPLLAIGRGILLIIEFSELPEAHGAYLWCAAAGGFVVAGYFALCGLLRLERHKVDRSAARYGRKAVVSKQQETVTRQTPFASPFRAQVWFEFQRYRSLLTGLLIFAVCGAVLSAAVLIPSLWNLASPLSTVVFVVMTAVKVVALISLGTGAWVVGMLMLSNDHLLGTRHRNFLFARPLATRQMAKARLRALFKVAVILLTVMLVVEGLYQAALYAEHKAVETRVAEVRAKAGLSAEGPLPEGMGSDVLRGRVEGLKGSVRISFTDPAWFLLAAAFALLVWSCLSIPVPVAVVTFGTFLLAELLHDRASWPEALVYAFAVLFGGGFLYTAQTTLRRRLVRWQTVVLCFAALGGVLVFMPSHITGWPLDGPARVFSVTVLTIPLFPFTVFPWWLQRQRHR